MSDHLIAEANRHAMALPTTHPTHADIAWYVREVDQLRAEVKRLLKQVKDDNRSYGCELRDPYGTIWEQATNDHARAERAEAEVEELKESILVQRIFSDYLQRAESAEAIVGKLQELHGCSQEMVVHWCEHAANRSLGLDQARSELATEREKAERYRLATLRLDAELAAERARLDWVFRNCKVTADDYTTGHRDVYAIHDREDLGAAMKEDAQ